MQYSQEHLKTMVYAKFGGQTECIMGNWKIGNYAKQQFCKCITLFCTFLCSPCITKTWNDQILSLLGNGSGKAINSTISVRTWARSPLFSSNPNSLLLGNSAPWNNRQKKVKGCEVLFFSDVFMDVAVVRS